MDTLGVQEHHAPQASHARLRARPGLLALLRVKGARLHLGLLFLLWVLNGVDMLLTIHAVNVVGWAAEGNALLRGIVGLLGPVGFVAYKLGIVTAVILLLWGLWVGALLRSRDASDAVARRTAVGVMRLAVVSAGILVVFFGAVVVNNLVVLA